MRHRSQGRREGVAFNLSHGWALALSVAVLASHVSAAATPACEGSPFVLQGRLLKHVESEVAASTTAFQGEVIAAVPSPDSFLPGDITPPPPVYDQILSFRVLHPWKGPYHAGETVSLTVTVVNFCEGLGCVFPFKIGDVTLVLSPSSAPDRLEGCWVHEGVVFQNVLSVPARLMPHS
jgi:hypothetical protein